MVESNDTTNNETEEMDSNETEEMEQDFESLFESSMQELHVGDVVRGTIVQVNDDNVVVDVGYKSEGVIPLAEFKDEEGKIDVNVGDEIDVLFERRENESGLIGLSKEKADRQKIWGSLEEGAVVEGKIPQPSDNQPIIGGNFYRRDAAVRDDARRTDSCQPLDRLRRR